MIEFYTPPLLITDYYDSLISQLDIYTEERIKEINEKGLKKEKISFRINNFISPKRANPVETINNPYESQKYTIDRTDISETEITEILQAEEYLNNARQKAINEIRKVQEENLKYYKANKDKFNVDRKNLTDEKLKELKSQLFATKFCFLILNNPTKNVLIEIEKQDMGYYDPIFNLHTIITDFYLGESDIEYIRFLLFKVLSGLIFYY